jgi:hypothetical protein
MWSKFAKRQVLADFGQLRTGNPQIIWMKLEPVPRPAPIAPGRS